MPILAISTNKGGVLKTSLTTNLAGVLCQQNKRVLIIDTDNQGNALLSFGINPDQMEKTLYDVLIDGLDPREAIINVHENIDILPSNDDMSFFELDCLSNLGKYPEPFMLLKNAMKGFDKEYDYILIDSPPTLGLVQGNILCYTERVLTPFQPEAYSMRSLTKILKAIQGFKEKLNPSLSVAGIVATLVDSRTTLHSQVLQECRKFCLHNDIPMFETVIPRSVRFASSVAYERKPATLVEKKNPLILAYFDLLEEVEGIGTKK
ncbi:ParA family protein [Metabacillus fastidiosus]|uniref:ParA family protein n=1 Tax=Metabacillus fastidiosus TaxID=1458 RepID=UPI002E228632|nr:ParA family protein [Metabacillus fastidiosus]